MDIQDLDDVLKSLNNLEKPVSFHFTEIKSLFEEKRFTDRQLELLLLKLIDDNYIITKKSVSKTGEITKDSIPLYHITYDGVEFLKEGGYAEKSKLLETKIQSINKRNQLYDFAQVATVLVGFYYFFLILKELLIPMIFFYF